MRNIKKLDNNVISQIKNFTFHSLTQEQRLLVDKLVPDQELKQRYEKYGLCKECQQPNNSRKWCQSCNSQHFEKDFSKWASGNLEIDKFIQKHQLKATHLDGVLEWIPFSSFTNIEYLVAGGFSTVYKARWSEGCIDHWKIQDHKWQRSKVFPSQTVALKNLNNSQEINSNFLQEIAYYALFNDDSDFNHIVRCYGISQNTQTSNYIIVMQYIENGNIRKYLNNHYNKLDLENKLSQLKDIAKGLKSIHEQELVHQDLHPGNILNKVIGDNVLCYVTDLGLSGPVNRDKEKKIYGVLPYVAPEVLRRKPYTQAADIYSFGMVVYEVLTNFPPYHELNHKEFLAVKICQGLRPKFQTRIPKLLEDLVKKCWNSDPSQRPVANELHENLNTWHQEIRDGKNTEFYQQYKEMVKINFGKKISFDYQIHTSEIYTSRLLDFRNLPEPQNSQETNNSFYKLSEELEELRIDNLIQFNEELEKKFSKLQIERQQLQPLKQ